GGDTTPGRLGECRVVREIGRGGMGVVYEAEQESLGRRVALKVLPAATKEDLVQLQRFRREARAAARLHHTNIVPVYGVGEDGGVHYYVMQFIQGLALDQVLDQLRRFRQDRSAPADRQAALTVAECNGPGIQTSVVAVAQALLTGAFGKESPGPGCPPLEENRSPQANDAAIHLTGHEIGVALSNTGRPYFRSVARIGVQVAEALAYANGQGT